MFFFLIFDIYILKELGQVVPQTVAVAWGDDIGTAYFSKNSIFKARKIIKYKTKTYGLIRSSFLSEIFEFEKLI